MPITANTIIARTQRVYADLDSTSALAYLNDVDEEVLTAVPWRRSTRAIPLVAGVHEYALLEGEIRIWAARYLQSGNFDAETHLSETSFDTLDREQAGWRAKRPGVPAQFYVSSDANTGVIGLCPAPETNSLTVTAAAASPVVLTTQSHNIQSGELVLVQGISGLSGANGRFYTERVSGTQIKLYRDSGLSQAVTGTGSYTSGGVIAGSGSPVLIIECTSRTEYTGAENFPTTPQLRDLYVAGICRRFAMERDQQKLGMWDQLFSARLGEFSRAYWGRASKFRPSLSPSLVRQVGGRS